MYTFQPLPDHSDIHVGFYVLMVIGILVWMFLLSLWKEDEIETATLSGWTVVMGILLYYAGLYSYTPVHPLNEQHVGVFVGYQPEGYRERSGKQMVDNHYIYVVYEVNGMNVLFTAGTGMAYPKRVVLYKN